MSPANSAEPTPVIGSSTSASPTDSAAEINPSVISSPVIPVVSESASSPSPTKSETASNPC